MSYERTKFLLTLMLGIWGTGIGLRFIIAYFTGDWYPYNSGVAHAGSPELDLIFDWGILFTLGLSVWIIKTKEWFDVRRKSN